MRAEKAISRLVLAAVVAGAVAFGTDSYAGRPGGGGKCPRNILCPDVWDPVICSDGVVYSNGCYAYAACATGCVPYGDDGPIELSGDKANCDRPRVCPELWAPVICDDGRIYPNECYARKKCATGCVPYGDPMASGGDKGNCERPKFCPLLWAPVICDDGNVYPNECYARKKCATGCVPYGDLLAADGDKKKPGGGGGCPRDILCPDIWDPVICSDGVVYSNGCYAYAACATGCVPYGDDGPIPLGGDKKKPGGSSECPRLGWSCPDVWDPVICSDGQVYSNACYAWVWCATGCVPYGDGGPILLDGDKKKPGGGGCPRDILCPDIWDPVICSDGQVYSNSCYAFAACATGCVPYGDDLLAAGDKKKPGGSSECPRLGWSCPDIWDPVICDDGQVYSNACYAWVWCATGCVPYDDGGPILLDGDKKKPGGGGCPRDILCPDIWDPVICSDGQVYSNSCNAFAACATGCVPYDDGGPIALGGDKKKPGGGGGCPRDGWLCPDIWDPVICDDGQVYSNSCYAWVACATGCEPYGDGGPIELGGDKGRPLGGCPRHIYCLDVWDPVVCDDGQVYSNSCYAYRACATGCVPLGDVIE